ncbi:hypothetical protein ABE527_05235 [Brucella sp. TWI432]
MTYNARQRPPCMSFLQGEIGMFDRIDPVLGTVAYSAPDCTAPMQSVLQTLLRAPFLTGRKLPLKNAAIS